MFSSTDIENMIMVGLCVGFCKCSVFITVTKHDETREVRILIYTNTQFVQYKYKHIQRHPLKFHIIQQLTYPSIYHTYTFSQIYLLIIKTFKTFKLYPFGCIQMIFERKFLCLCNRNWREKIATLFAIQRNKKSTNLSKNIF